MPIFRSGLLCSNPGIPLEHEVEDLALGGRVAFVELADEHGGVGVRAVGDERLRAVEHVLVAVASRRGLHPAERVRSRSWAR